MLDVVYAIIIGLAPDGKGLELMKALDEKIAEATATEADWGVSSEAQAGARAMMAMLG